MKYLYLLPMFAVGCGSTFTAGGPDKDAPTEAVASCLAAIPASCPNCVTMNPSDKSTCQKYVTCFESNDCDPTGACGQPNGVCGVNTIGGGSAPQTAAVATFRCACP